MFCSSRKLLQRQLRQLRRQGSLLLFVLILLALLGGVVLPTASQTNATEKHYLYVGVNGGIEVYDIEDGHAHVKTIKIPNIQGVRGMQAHSPTGRLYMSYYRGFNDGTGLLAFDLISDKVVWHKHFPPFADALSMTPDGKKIFMASGEVEETDYFFVIDTATGNLLDKIHIHEGTHNTIVSLNGKHVYFASVDYNYLTMADAKTHKILKKIGPFDAPIRPFTINGRETLVFANIEHLQGFEVANIKTGKKLYKVAVKGFPYTLTNDVISHAIGLSPDEKELWVGGAGKRVFVFDATQMPPKQVASVPLSRWPGWVNFSIDGRYVYTGSGDVVNAKTRKKVAQIAHSRRFLQIDFANGVPIRDGDIYGLGKVTTTPPPSTAPTLDFPAL